MWTSQKPCQLFSRTLLFEGSVFLICIAFAGTPIRRSCGCKYIVQILCMNMSPLTLIVLSISM